MKLATCSTARRSLWSIALLTALLLGTAAKVRAAQPVITGVSQISATQTQVISIYGRGFGTMVPYNGDSDFIMLSDITRNWNAGHSGNLVGLIVAEWTDSKIVLQGFSGSYGGGWSLAPGDVLVVRVWNAQSAAAPASLSTKVGAAEPAAPPVMTDDPLRSAAQARIVKATIREQATSLELPAGKMYLYGMETGGGFPSSPFAEGQYAKVENADGRLSAALAYGTNNRNSYSTQTAYHTIGGVSIGGSWKDFAAFYGSNRKREAHDASVSFQTSEDSLVVVFGLAGDQKVVGFDGIPGLEVDASGGGELIAHAYVRPGTFNVVEHSAVAAAGQDPSHMTDLVGVFVFGGEESRNSPATVSESSPASGNRGSDAKRSVHDVDFQNFDYTSNCLAENMPAEVIHTSNGQANNQDGEFWADKPVYGDFKGDGHELAAVALGCHPANMSPNVNFSEVFIFQLSSSGPKLVATLPPSFWKERRVTGLKVSNQQLAVDYLEMGDRGSNACPEWVVTSKLHWDGNSFVTASESRRKNSCAQ